ncbi:hypothetical protein A2392_02780 [Candidatus Kaiserbacteria bacterium RIFOXYB1_FULL_46_14]|uniref:Aminoacyl-tRNA hydrolase n=1 Tax=Candidatus Kaiserbacteria bacterium RIFOXYB1_FULL_46_14 TaxID=1798531 RepID=A0A1F6FIS5_9BACT|nr:MAG: hypothetical protein A2392_02780 [Candidatus Kaiserbacteria bacterium RIFOXYB1_FULL_46_14]
MYTIVGLGNPGDEYELTRHNAGRVVLREIFDLASLRLGRSERLSVGNTEINILFPDSYMNESGRAIRKFIAPEDLSRLIVVYDDIDLPLGEFKLSFGRGDGGHNGLSSIIASLDTKDFIRVRVGIAKHNFWGRLVRPQGEELSRYVLGRFSSRELATIKQVSSLIKEALEVVVGEGVEKAMNRFN